MRCAALTIAAVVLTVPLSVLPFGCTTIDVTSQRTTIQVDRPARINHPVFVKLIDAADRDAFIRDCDRLLPSIPGVVSYYCGVHFDAGRDSVIKDYDVGLYVGFETAEAYAMYVDHPQHVELVTSWRSRLEWLKVYDVIDVDP
ncbi:MAG: Dabb family protein [Planctomycetota bacterium]